MRSVCTFVGHRRPAAGTWNNGYFFSNCPRCGTELIKRGNDHRWKDVPKGYRVQWKPMGEHDVRW